MIISIAHISLLVLNYDEAKNFYCDQLGFICLEDTLITEGKRWIRIQAPGGRGSEIILSKASNEAERQLVGRQNAERVFLFLYCDNFHEDFKDLENRGILFIDGPFDRAHGKVAVFKDIYGNRIDLIQPLKPSP